MSLDHEELELTCRVEFAWWVHAYLYMIEAFCNLVQREPDYDKLAAIMAKGAKIKIEAVEVVKNGDES